MNRIVCDPEVLAGKPTIAGTRIPVTLVLNLIAHGQTLDEIIEDYPRLTVEDLKAAVSYAEKIVNKVPSAQKVAVAHEISRR